MRTIDCSEGDQVHLGTKSDIVSREAAQIRMLIDDLARTVDVLDAAIAADLPRADDARLRAATILWSPLLLWRIVSGPWKTCALARTRHRLIPLFLALEPHGLTEQVF